MVIYVLSPDYWIRKHVVEIFFFYLFLVTYIVFSWILWFTRTMSYNQSLTDTQLIVSKISFLWTTLPQPSRFYIFDPWWIFLRWIPGSRLRRSEKMLVTELYSGAIQFWFDALQRIRWSSRQDHNLLDQQGAACVGGRVPDPSWYKAKALPPTW